MSEWDVVTGETERRLVAAANDPTDHRVQWLEDPLYPRCPCCDQTMVEPEIQNLASVRWREQKIRHTKT